MIGLNDPLKSYDLISFFQEFQSSMSSGPMTVFVALYFHNPMNPNTEGTL